MDVNTNSSVWRRSGFYLALALTTVGCIAPILDAEKVDRTELDFAPTGERELIFERLEQDGARIRGWLVAQVIEEERRCTWRGRRVPTMYRDGDGGATISPRSASTVYYLLLPLSVLNTIAGGGSGWEAATWRVEPGKLIDEEPTGLRRTAVEPVDGELIGWTLELPRGVASGEVLTDAGGRWMIDLTAYWELIRNNLDRAVEAPLRLLSPDGELQSELMVNLLDVDNAVLGSGGGATR